MTSEVWTALIALGLGVLTIPIVRWINSKSGTQGTPPGSVGYIKSITALLKANGAMLGTTLVASGYIIGMVRLLFPEWAGPYYDQNGITVLMLILGTVVVIWLITLFVPKGAVRSGFVWGSTCVLVAGLIYNIPSRDRTRTPADNKRVAVVVQRQPHVYTTTECPGNLVGPVTLDSSSQKINKNCIYHWGVREGRLIFDGNTSYTMGSEGGNFPDLYPSVISAVGKVVFYYQACPKGTTLVRDACVLL